MFSKLKQIKDLRSQAKTIQNALSTEFAEGTAAWGKIKVQMNGNMEITQVTIDPELLQEQGKEKIEAGIREASNAVIKKIQKIMAEKVQKMGGLNLGTKE